MDAAARLGRTVVETLGVVALPHQLHPVTRVTAVEVGSRVLRVPATNADDNNSCLEVYFQFGAVRVFTMDSAVLGLALPCGAFWDRVEC